MSSLMFVLRRFGMLGDLLCGFVKQSRIVCGSLAFEIFVTLEIQHKRS
jgi:hypothetical protein